MNNICEVEIRYHGEIAGNYAMELVDVLTEWQIAEFNEFRYLIILTNADLPYEKEELYKPKAPEYINNLDKEKFN